MKIDRIEALHLAGLAAVAGLAGILSAVILMGKGDPTPPREDSVVLSAAAPPEPSVRTPRPYLTEQTEVYMLRDHCEISKQRCRQNGVCITCMICLDGNRRLLGSAFTKCKSPTDCEDLTDNVAWEREKVDPGWCEGMPFEENP
jgi:hypothetical protein